MLKTKHQKKAFVESIVVMLILIALMFVSGLKYLDPPPPGNIAINFGTSDRGQGRIQPPRPVKSNPQPVKPQPAKEEKVLTSDNSEAPVVKQQTPKKTKKTKTEKPKKPTPKPSKDASNALNNLFNGQASGGEGDDDTAGDKGDLNGDLNSDSRTGSGKGSGGGGGNYFLGNRRATVKPKPKYNCNENGRVVVIIKVDRAGNVRDARTGRGTTASACLTKAAIEAAYKTRWEPDPNADELQTGKIIYDFKLN